MTTKTETQIKTIDTKFNSSAILKILNQYRELNGRDPLKGTGVSKSTLLKNLEKEALVYENFLFDLNKREFGLEMSDYKSIDLDGENFDDLCILVRIDLMGKRANDVRELLIREEEEKKKQSEVVLSVCTVCGKKFNEKTERWVSYDGETYCEECQDKNDPKLESYDINEDDGSNDIIIPVITAVEIATEIGTDAKSLRRKLRVLADKLPETVKPGRWVFKLEYKDEVINILSHK